MIPTITITTTITMTITNYYLFIFDTFFFFLFTFRRIILLMIELIEKLMTTGPSLFIYSRSITFFAFRKTCCSIHSYFNLEFFIGIVFSNISFIFNFTLACKLFGFFLCKYPLLSCKCCSWTQKIRLLYFKILLFINLYSIC